jgi:hypothetical protein
MFSAYRYARFEFRILDRLSGETMQVLPSYAPFEGCIKGGGQ